MEEAKETVIYDDIHFPEGDALKWLKEDFVECAHGGAKLYECEDCHHEVWGDEADEEDGLMLCPECGSNALKETEVDDYDSMLWEYWRSTNEYNFEDDIKDGLFKNVEERVLVRGASHRWDGTRYGYQDFCTIEEAYDWVTKDCDYCRVVEDEHGELNIVGYHHDGSCSVEVREMTDAAGDFFDEWEDADEGEPLYKMSTHDALERVWNLCQPLDYCHKAWGCASKVTSAGAAEC